MPQILIASRNEAFDILTNPKYNDKVTAVVSIYSPHQVTPLPVKKLLGYVKKATML